LDDYFALFAWAATVSWSAVLIASRNYGIGRHLWDIPPDWLVPGLKYLFVTELLYIPIVLAVKLSFFICLNRIFSGKIRYYIWFGIVSNVIFYVIVFFYTLFLCKPIALAWNPFLDGTCGPEESLPYATGIWGFLSDFYVFVLPLPCVWNLNMKMERKVKLTIAFSVGLFACIASIIRFVFTIQLVDNVDSTWNYIKLSIWSVLEVDIGLVCSCLLCSPAFMKRHNPSKWYYNIIHFASRSGSSGNSDGANLAPLHLRGDQSGRTRNYYSARVGRGDSKGADVEALPLRDRDGVNVKRTVDLNHYPNDGYMGEYNSEDGN